jgi:hypothetical protein
MRQVITDVNNLLLIENDKRGLCLCMSYLQALALPDRETPHDMRLEIKRIMIWLVEFLETSPPEDVALLSSEAQAVIRSWDDDLIQEIVDIDGRIPPG